MMSSRIEIDRLLCQHLQRRRAVGGRDRIVAEQLQLLLEQVDVQGLIVGDQNPRPSPFEVPAPWLAGIEEKAELLEQEVLIDRLLEIVVAAAGPRLGLVALHGMRGERDHGDTLELRDRS